MASPDHGDLRWYSKSGRSRERKRISNRNIIPLVNTFHDINYNRGFGFDRSSSLPLIPSLNSSPTCACGEKRSRDCALAALATLNKKGHQFELVKPLGCVWIRQSGLFHCNFIARPIGGSEADDKLCFAEVKVDLWKELEELRAAEDEGKEAILTSSKCVVASILGPPGTTTSKTGLNGCRSLCTKSIGYIQHPKGVRFEKR